MTRMVRLRATAIATQLLALCLLSGCDGRATAPKHKHHQAEGRTEDSSVVEFDLTSGVAESTASGGLFPLPAMRTFTGLVRAIERTQADRNVKAIYLRLGMHRLDFAKVEELSTLLSKVKERTPVYCHAHALSNSTLWFTLKSCSKTFLSPAGDVDAIGMSMQMVYIKSLLDKLGVKADFLSVGKFKSAAESLLRDAPSEAARQEWLETLGSIRQSWHDSVGAVRADQVPNLENGPFGAQKALELKLVDALGDEHEARADALSRGGASATKIAYGTAKQPASGAALSEVLSLLSGLDEADSKKPHIAVIPLAGSITMGSDGLFESEGINEHAVTKTLERLKNDDSVRAVVLRLDSPGGSALASDLMWSRLRELAQAKLLVASVGGMAASGGYYLACAASRIFASETSIVGSIGVVGGKIVIGPALEPYGVHAISLAPGKDAQRPTYESALFAWDEATRARVYEQMRGVYDLFVSRVSEGRKLSREKVYALAEGRIYSGKQGRDIGLVDEIGGLYQTLEYARKQVGLSKEAPVTVEGQSDGLLSALGLDREASSEQFALALEQHRKQLWSPLAMVPREWVPWVSGVSPLLSHETVLALSPFAVQAP